MITLPITYNSSSSTSAKNYVLVYNNSWNSITPNEQYIWSYNLNTNQESLIIDNSTHIIISLATNPYEFDTIYYNTGVVGGTYYCYKTTNYGTSWTNPFSSTTVWFGQMLFSSASIGWALATDNSFGNKITVYKSTNAGDTWAVANTRVFDDSDINTYRCALGMSSDTTGMVLLLCGSGTNNGTIKTCYSTDSWASYTMNTYTSTYTSNSFVGYKVVSNTTAYMALTGGKIIKTTDSGSTWSTVKDFGTSIGGFYADTTSIFYAAVGTIVYKTSDSGANWSVYFQSALSVSSSFPQIDPSYCSNPTLFKINNDIFGVNSSTINASFNGGNSFSTVNHGVLAAIAVKKFTKPSDISNLAAWYSNTYNSGRTRLYNNDKITQWDDLSGNNKHVTQATSSKQPVYSLTEKAVLFDGVDDGLTYSGSAIVSGSTARTIFVVWKTLAKTSNANPVILDGAVSATANSYFLWNDASSVFQLDLNSGQRQWPSTTTSTKYIGTMNYSGGTISNTTFRRNGVLQTAGTTTNNTPSTNNTEFRIGNCFLSGNTFYTQTLNGYVYEVIIYNRSLTSSEVTLVETYLNNKYSAF